jgi:hypothetical protein
MAATPVRSSSEYGWLVIDREEYEKLRGHEYAGPGTPLDPDAPGLWVTAYEENVGTVLYTGVTFA